MIEYRFDEEKEYVTHYAEKLGNDLVLLILSKGEVVDANEAMALSEFFWNMVDASIQDEEPCVEIKWVEGSEYWNEKIMNSISGYLERTGFENVWDEVVDRQ